MLPKRSNHRLSDIARHRALRTLAAAGGRIWLAPEMLHAKLVIIDDLGNNSLNWQWIAGTGSDSSPFARIMAPLSQSAKFDAAGYIRQWVPELADLTDADIHDPVFRPAGYPQPLIGHKEARERALLALAEPRNG